MEGKRKLQLLFVAEVAIGGVYGDPLLKSLPLNCKPQIFDLTVVSTCLSIPYLETGK